MNIKKSKYSVTIVLVLIPVFLLYLKYSVVNYHSHVFANGEIITHFHSCKNDCEGNTTGNSKNNPEKQIIIFHPFSLDLGDDLPEFFFTRIIQLNVERIINTDTAIHSFLFYLEMPGRDPPIIHS